LFIVILLYGLSQKAHECSVRNAVVALPEVLLLESYLFSGKDNHFSPAPQKDLAASRGNLATKNLCCIFAPLFQLNLR
jgi:hypothetical protein